MRRICTDRGGLMHGRASVELGIRIAWPCWRSGGCTLRVCKSRNPHMVLILSYSLLDVRRPAVPHLRFCRSSVHKNPPPFSSHPTFTTLQPSRSFSLLPSPWPRSPLSCIILCAGPLNLRTASRSPRSPQTISLFPPISTIRS